MMAGMLLLAGCGMPGSAKPGYAQNISFGKDLLQMENYELAEQAFFSAFAEAKARGLSDGKKAWALYYLGETRRRSGRLPEAEQSFRESAAFASSAWRRDVAASGVLNAGFVMLYRDMNAPEKGWPFLRDTFGQPEKGRGDMDWAAVYREYLALLEKAGMTREAEELRAEIKK